MDSANPETWQGYLDRRDDWQGTPTGRGSIPRVRYVDALPTAGEQWGRSFVVLNDPSDDALYICLKVATVWTWVQIV